MPGLQMCLLVRHMGEGGGREGGSHIFALQASWDFLCCSYVFTVWVICLLIQRQLVDNLLAQVMKFRKQVVWQMLQAGKFPDLLPKISESGPEKPVGSKAL